VPPAKIPVGRAPVATITSALAEIRRAASSRMDAGLLKSVSECTSFALLRGKRSCCFPPDGRCEAARCHRLGGTLLAAAAGGPVMEGRVRAAPRYGCDSAIPGAMKQIFGQPKTLV